MFNLEVFYNDLLEKVNIAKIKLSESNLKNKR